jgi:hypothetical protein
MVFQRPNPPKTELELARENVKLAQAQLEAAEAEAEALRRAEYVERITSRFEAMMVLPDEAFYAGDDARHDVRPYVLPFGTDYPKWNPTGQVEEHGFGETWTANSTAIICTRTDQDRTTPTRLIWTSGMVMPSKGDRVSGDLIGQRFLARHDQTGAKLGEYVIVGLAFYGPEGGSSPARIVGEVPDRKFGQSTYK